MNLALVSFKDVDCSDAIDELLLTYEEPTVLVPIVRMLPKFFDSVVTAVNKHKATRKVTLKFFFLSADGYDKYLKEADDLVLSDNPVKEMINNLGANDALGIVWDDGAPSHFVVHSVEDLAMEIWDISDELMPLDLEDIAMDLDGDVLHEELIATMGKFIDLMCAFVANAVMESLGEAVAEHMRLSLIHI